MADLEKVVWSLERCASSVPDACKDCKYDNFPPRICVAHLAKDALELLKEQKPRVITIDEFRQYSGETMWLETKNNELQQLTMDGIAIVLMEAEINRWDGCGSYWRCWNKRPTDEQRREVKWDV